MTQRRLARTRWTLALPGLLIVGILAAPGGTATAETDVTAGPTTVAASSRVGPTPAQMVRPEDIDWDISPVENLRVEARQVNARSLTTKLSISWDAPDDWDLDGEYRVLYSTDWRPQKWYELTTGEESAVLKNLWPGRLYTIVVQASAMGTWGTPALLDEQTPKCEAGSQNPRCPIDDPNSVPWVVSLGDSFISGEAGRWAGNSDDKDSSIEAAGQARAYYDYEDGEIIRGCHRSNAAVVHLLVTKSMNLACSGAITTSAIGEDNYKAMPIVGLYPWEDMWKPGIDFANFDHNPELPDDVIGPAIGQAQLLQDFARNKDVRMVMLSIGGNNFGFGGIVSACTESFLTGSTLHCKDNQAVTRGLEPEAVARTRGEIVDAIGNIVQAMEAAGHPLDTWVLGYQMYPRPIATSGEMRYPESGLTRQWEGGCGMWDDDADWALDTAVPIINGALKEAAQDAVEAAPGLKVVFLDTTNAFAGHELCNKSVYRVDDSDPEDRKGVTSFRRKGAVDKSEWVKEIDLSNFSKATIEESFHPNYWGQLAMRNCWRQLYSRAMPRASVANRAAEWRERVEGGACQPLQGLNVHREPNMYFEVDSDLTLGS